MEHPPATVTVHLVPHSHMDPGWLATVDEMFTGAYPPCIRDLISGLVAALSRDPTAQRTFAPEIGIFFDLWWKTANVTQQEQLRDLVKAGRVTQTLLSASTRDHSGGPIY